MAKFSLNKVVRTLIQTDLIFISSFGLITPVFAVFITKQIEGGDVEVVGFAAAIYWIFKAILQIPIGKFLSESWYPMRLMRWTRFDLKIFEALRFTSRIRNSRLRSIWIKIKRLLRLSIPVSA